MVKRYFVPIWKINNVESKLSELESQGFRLNRISGFCRYEFIPCSPQNTSSYYFTVNLIKENLMETTEQDILKNNGNKISGSLYFGLCSVNVYRVANGQDTSQYNDSRRASIYSVLKTRLQLNAFLMLISLLCITAELIIGGFPVSSFSLFEFLVILFIIIISTISFIYDLKGMFFIKKI